MINKLLFLLFLLLLQKYVMAGSELPVDTLGSKDTGKPLVLYISGDGGFNSFSTSFMKEWNSKGYPVVALNAKSYFWKTKQPDIASKEVSDLIVQYLTLWKRNEVILIGYSFGADVLPFIQTRMPAALLGKVAHTVLLSPSRNTDFTVHLFYNSEDGSSVPSEINKLNKPALVIFGKEETDIPDKQINNKMITITTVAGDHHYNNEVAFLTDEIVKRL